MLLKNLFKYWTFQIFAPGNLVREKYEAFKSLLNHDKRAHELMAELEEVYYSQIAVDLSVIENSPRIVDQKLRFQFGATGVDAQQQDKDRPCGGRQTARTGAG